MDACAIPQRGNLRSGALVLFFGKQVGLVDEHHSLGAAALDEHEVALHAAEVKIRARIGDHGYEIDIRADHLCLGTVAGHLAGEAGAPWQHGADHIILVFASELHGHPVAHGGEVGIAGGLVPDAAAEHGIDFLAVIEECTEVDGRLTDQARRHPAFGAIGCEGSFKSGVPAEILEGHPPQNLARDTALSIPGFAR